MSLKNLELCLFEVVEVVSEAEEVEEVTGVAVRTNINRFISFGKKYLIEI